MGLVLTDDRHYKAIAEAVRAGTKIDLNEHFGTDKMTPEEMSSRIAFALDSNYESGLDIGNRSGFEAGLEEGANICADKHFVHTFVGAGSASYSFHVPFEPDMVYILGFDPLAVNKAWALMEFVYDRRAFGIVGGFTQYGSGTGGAMNMAFTTTSALTRYSRTQDGTITIKNIGGTAGTIVYATGFIYTVVAVKYTEQTDNERITAFVNGLTGSGAVTLNQAKAKAAFTDAEWSALIATKPSWTFNWI